VVRGHKMAVGGTESTSGYLRVNKKSVVSRSAFGFIISNAPQFRNPYLTKVTNQLGSTLLVTYVDRDTFSISLELLK
jgi:hypothetical protein